MNLAQLFRDETDLLALPAGHTLFNQDEHGDLMYVLMSGTAYIIVNEKVVETAEAVAIVGELAMIQDYARSATVIAKSDCMFLPIDREKFYNLIRQEPHFAQRIMVVMADRLRKTNELL